jgi:hypothetical protein
MSLSYEELLNETKETRELIKHVNENIKLLALNNFRIKIETMDQSITPQYCPKILIYITKDF